jgi:hypothetical protein
MFMQEHSRVDETKLKTQHQRRNTLQNTATRVRGRQGGDLLRRVDIGALVEEELDHVNVTHRRGLDEGSLFVLMEGRAPSLLS